MTLSSYHRGLYSSWDLFPSSMGYVLSPFRGESFWVASQRHDTLGLLMDHELQNIPPWSTLCRTAPSIGAHGHNIYMCMLNFGDKLEEGCYR